MGNFVFLYDIVCYSISLVGFLFALLTAFLKKRPEEWAYLFLIGSFFFIFVPFSIHNYISLVGGNASAPLQSMITLTNMVGCAMMTYSSPKFSHAVSRFPKARLLNSLFLAAAVFLFIIFLAMNNFIPILVGMVIAIVYSVIAGNIMGRTKDETGRKRVLDRRWVRLTWMINILTIVFIPCSVLLDMFPSLWPAFSSLFPPNLRVVPLYFMLWNLGYIVFTLPLYLPKAPLRGEHTDWDFSPFRLSRRESEVALLILQGLPYQSIANRLYISLATVKTHVTRIYEKTGAGNKMELANTCRRHTPKT